MASPLRSVTDLMTNQNSYGNWDLLYHGTVRTVGTAATVTSGYTTCARFGETITMPTMTSPVVRAYCTFSSLATQQIVAYRAGIEVNMGTLTISGNSFSAGATMPSRRIAGATASAQTAAYDPLLYSATAYSGTAPTITITYTNQSGTTGRTATLVLTGAAIGTIFRIAPHLQSGDTGIRAVTAVSSSGSNVGGSLQVLGYLPVVSAIAASTGQGSSFGMAAPFGNEIYGAEAGDVIAFYEVGTANANRILVQMSWAPEV